MIAYLDRGDQATALGHRQSQNFFEYFGAVRAFFHLGKELLRFFQIAQKFPFRSRAGKAIHDRGILLIEIPDLFCRRE